MRRSEPVEGRFTGGPLASIAFELDALYYGTAHENRRRLKEWRERDAAFVTEQVTNGVPEEELEHLPRPKLLDTSIWIEYLSLIDDPYSLPSNADPSKAVNFRLDVLRSLSTLPPSRIKAFTHYMDGFDIDEIAPLMGKNEELGGGWETNSVRHAIKEASRTCRHHGDALIDEPTKRYIGVPRTETATETEKRIAGYRKSRARQLANHTGSTSNV